MSRTNETRYTEWHGTCKCKCRLDTSVCNDKERWNKVCLCVYVCVCACVCVCDKGFIWNWSNCDFECDKSCDIGEYLDYENCKNWLINWL